MKCQKSNKISAYFDAELSEAEKRRFEMHIQECAACRLRLDNYDRLRRGFVQSERQSVPAWFSTRVISRARSRSSRPSVLFPVMVRVAEVMVVVLMITIGIISGRLLVNGGQGQMAANIGSAFSLDVFDPAPPDSPGGVYLAMMEETHEE